MPSFGVTNNGFSLPLLEDIRADMELKFRTRIPSIDFGDASVEKAIADIMSDTVHDLYGSMFDVYNAQNPRFAFGCKLDILANRNGLARIAGETDSALQDRILVVTSGSGLLSGSSCFDNVYNQLLQTNGVTEVQINLNDSPETVGGLAPNSYEVMVLGGDDVEVANIIWNNHPAGITLSGNSSVQITDCRGVCREVSFTRPRFVPIFLDFRLRRTSTNCGCPTDNTDVVKNAIESYLNSDNGVCFTRIGQPVNVQDFFGAIYSIQGLGVTCAKVSRDGLEAKNDVVTLRRDEVPYFTIDCINIQFTPESQSPCETGIYLLPPSNCGFALELTRTADVSEFTTVGTIISYQYTVKNIGLTAIQSPILISDDKVSVVCNGIGGGLPVGDSITCSGTYETTYDDAINGSILSRAQAISGNSFSSIEEISINYTGVTLSHAVSVAKELISGSCDALGNILQYRYTVTNDGTIPLTIQPIVSDTEISGINLPSLPSGGLLPSSTLEATAQIIVTQDMLDAEQFCSTANVISGSQLGSVSGQQITTCTSCMGSGGGGGMNTPPTAPANILITDCASDFPVSTGLWITNAGPLTITSPNAPSLGLLVTDNGDNTATISVSGALQNGTIQILGVDSNGLSATQNFTVNCQTVASITAAPSIGVTDCSNDFPLNIGTWIDPSGGLVLSANGTDTAIGLSFSQSGNSGTISAINPQSGVVIITGTNSAGSMATQAISVFCGSIGGGGCFTAGTKVLMPNNRLKNIEDIVAGDVVTSSSGSPVKVLDSYFHKYTGSLVRVNMGSAFFTAGHPVMSSDGWVSLSPQETLIESPDLSVSEMKIGTLLSRIDGQESVNSLGSTLVSGIDVYNIHTEDNTYVANGYLVHNKEINPNTDLL